MRIIGYIRKDDVAACGGKVIEGDETTISWDRPLTYQGAQLNCSKRCVIKDGLETDTLDGRQMVLHGMKTSGGCPLISTLNDLDGHGVEPGQEVPIRFVQENGQWVGKMNEGFDQQFVLTDEATGDPLAHREYRIECDGKIIEGTTDGEGKTKTIEMNDPANAKITIMPEGA